MQTDAEKIGDSNPENTDTNQGLAPSQEDQLQPDIGSSLADIIPPAIEVVPKDPSEEEPAPKTRRRRRRNPASPSEEIEVPKVP